MITRLNLPLVLKALGFEEKGAKFVGYPTHFPHEELVVDTKKQLISYPNELRVNERQTLNFSHNENFVVLECVWRLLEKGYHPRHIELEKRWSLGHSAKGGRADICLYNSLGSGIETIIECKTPGVEYTKAHQQLRTDGGQLFSYRQQEGGS